MKKEVTFSILAVFFVFTLIAFSSIWHGDSGRSIASNRLQYVGYIDHQIGNK